MRRMVISCTGGWGLGRSGDVKGWGMQARAGCSDWVRELGCSEGEGGLGSMLELSGSGLGGVGGATVLEVVNRGAPKEEGVANRALGWAEMWA